MTPKKCPEGYTTIRCAKCLKAINYERDEGGLLHPENLLCLCQTDRPAGRARLNPKTVRMLCDLMRKAKL